MDYASGAWRALQRVVLAGVLVGCGASSLEVKTTERSAAQIAKRKTYSHATAENTPSGGYARSEATPDVLAKIRQAVDAGLEGKGYIVAPSDTGELIVRISAGMRKQIDSLGGAGRFGAPASSDTERGIAVDILEARSKEILFHGYARYDADPAVVDAAKIQEAVGGILVDVPNSTAPR
jgi:hypothetical protein